MNWVQAKQLYSEERFLGTDLRNVFLTAIKLKAVTKRERWWNFKARIKFCFLPTIISF